MTLEEALQECNRYINYLKHEEKKSLALQKLAADRRLGKCDDKEKDQRLREIMGQSPTVYDGANLADAMKVITPLILAELEKLNE